MTKQEVAREIDEIQQEMKCLDMRRDIQNHSNYAFFAVKYGFVLTNEIKQQILAFQFKHIDINGNYQYNYEYLRKLRDAKERELEISKDF